MARSGQQIVRRTALAVASSGRVDRVRLSLSTLAGLGLFAALAPKSWAAALTLGGLEGSALQVLGGLGLFLIPSLLVLPLSWLTAEMVSRASLEGDDAAQSAAAGAVVAATLGAAFGLVVMAPTLGGAGAARCLLALALALGTLGFRTFRAVPDRGAARGLPPVTATLLSAGMLFPTLVALCAAWSGLAALAPALGPLAWIGPVPEVVAPLLVSCIMVAILGPVSRVIAAAIQTAFPGTSRASLVAGCVLGAGLPLVGAAVPALAALPASGASMALLALTCLLASSTHAAQAARAEGPRALPARQSMYLPGRY